MEYVRCVSSVEVQLNSVCMLPCCVTGIWCSQGPSSKVAAAAMDVDGPAAQRESELGCVSGELSEWTASDHRIQTLTDNGQQQQQAVHDG